MTQRKTTIGSGAIVTACSILEGISTNAELESMLLEYGLSDWVPSRGTISKTLLAVKELAANNPDHIVRTDYGERPVSILLVEEAIRRFGRSAGGSEIWEKLERYLNLDGYSLLKERDDYGDEIVTGLTVAMPQFAKLPETASEVEVLLARYGFKEAERPLASAKKNIAQADWEAANSQCRTFLEALTNAIADTLYPSESLAKSSGLPKRQLLAKKGFLSREKHEFGDGNKQTFLPGLAKLLHPDGAHPGISNQPDAMFRLQLVVITARWLLKRLESMKAKGMQP